MGRIEDLVNKSLERQGKRDVQDEEARNQRAQRSKQMEEEVKALAQSRLRQILGDELDDEFHSRTWTVRVLKHDAPYPFKVEIDVRGHSSIKPFKIHYSAEAADLGTCRLICSDEATNKRIAESGDIWGRLGEKAEEELGDFFAKIRK